MTTEEVFAKLCYHDPRNPNGFPDEDSPAPREPRCGCDNCFYGRDRLAMEIIRLNELLATKSERKNA